MSSESVSNQSVSNVLIISSDCHAGALPGAYKKYMASEFHEASDAWWLSHIKEMMTRAGTFFDQEAVDKFAEDAGEEARGVTALLSASAELDDDALRAMLEDESNPFAPKRGEWDAGFRLSELEKDGVAGEVIFPQMAPFGAGLLQYRSVVDPRQNLEGIRTYNRWLADLCNANPGRHAGVALINVDDIDVTVQEVRDTKEMGLWGGVLLPTSTGEHPFYHHPRYEPLWNVCEELGAPIHAHSGWSPDYGDTVSATAMYISEVDMWAHRPFTALLWSGAFERHPGLEFVLTETGCSWILETLRLLEFKADMPLFKHFTKDLTLSPTEYFERQCYIGASFMPAHEGVDRYKIGIDKLMWGSDYPHMEGTWPNTMGALQTTFGTYPEAEIRTMLGTTAARVYGFDLDALKPIGDKIGPSLADITGGG
jgi:predicted TIM-barrel fold metal-dependent hydrolase